MILLFSAWHKFYVDSFTFNDLMIYYDKYDLIFFLNENVWRTKYFVSWLK